MARSPEKKQHLKRWLSIVFAAAFITMLSSSSAFGILFTFDGTSSADSRAQQGTAVFTTTNTSLTIVLTNTANPVGGISQIFDGLSFTFDTAPTGLTLTSVTASGVVTCTSGTSCVAYGGSNPTNYGWGVAGLSSPTLEPVGNKPYGIANGTIDATSDGIKNATHNPYLLGPVTFIFSVTGWTDPGSVTSATGIFGTAGETQPGTPFEPNTEIPEPATIVLLASGLLPLLRRYRRA